MLWRLTLALAILFPLPSGFVAACAKACNEAGATPFRCLDAQPEPADSCCRAPRTPAPVCCETEPASPDDDTPGRPPCCRAACLASLPASRHLLTQPASQADSILPRPTQPTPTPTAGVLWETPQASPSPQRPFERTHHPPPSPLREALSVWIE